jgi:hypothetical protein
MENRQAMMKATASAGVLLTSAAYGQRQSLSSISCDSELSGMACRDTGTGHYFALARDNYELH